MKVAIYARVSTDDKGQDPVNQLLELREFATRQGWTVVREYTDEATELFASRAQSGRLDLHSQSFQRRGLYTA